MIRTSVVIVGRNYHGYDSAPQHLDLPDGATVDDALGALAQRLPDGSTIPDTCLVAVSGAHLGTLKSHRPHILRDGDELLLLAPVAGG